MDQPEKIFSAVKLNGQKQAPVTRKCQTHNIKRLAFFMEIFKNWNVKGVIGKVVVFDLSANSNLDSQNIKIKFKIILPQGCYEVQQIFDSPDLL